LSDDAKVNVDFSGTFIYVFLKKKKLWHFFVISDKF